MRDMESCEIQANLLKTLAHPVRLYILAILYQKEACVCHLAAIIGRRQANISQHLMLLREAELVQDRRDGAQVYYRLADRRIPERIIMLCEAARLIEAMKPLQIPPGPVPGCSCPECSAQKHSS